MGRSSLPVLVLSAAFVVACCSKDSDARPDKAAKSDKVVALAVGDRAPSFSAPASTGGTLSLGDFAGRIVVLYFYPKDDTPGCTVQAKDFRDADARMAALGAQVLGVSRDGLESHLKFTGKFDLNFPLLSDTDGAIHDAYGAWKGGAWGRTPLGVDRSTFVIDGQGVIRKIWRSVDPAGHSDEVLAFVQTLAAGC